MKPTRESTNNFRNSNSTVSRFFAKTSRMQTDERIIIQHIVMGKLDPQRKKWSQILILDRKKIILDLKLEHETRTFWSLWKWRKSFVTVVAVIASWTWHRGQKQQSQQHCREKAAGRKASAQQMKNKLYGQRAKGERLFWARQLIGS